MIFPALPCSRINLVDATFRESLNIVVNNRSEGNVDNSMASLEARVIIRIAIEDDILQANSKSRIHVGKGISSVASTITTAMARMRLLCFIIELLSLRWLTILSDAGIDIPCQSVVIDPAVGVPYLLH